MVGEWRGGERVVYAREGGEAGRRGKSWEKGEKRIDWNQINRLLDLINGLSVHKKHELLRNFNAQYPSIRPHNGGFNITGLDLDQALTLIKLAAKL